MGKQFQVTVRHLGKSRRQDLKWLHIRSQEQGDACVGACWCSHLQSRAGRRMRACVLVLTSAVKSRETCACMRACVLCSHLQSRAGRRVRACVRACWCSHVQSRAGRRVRACMHAGASLSLLLDSAGIKRSKQKTPPFRVDLPTSVMVIKIPYRQAQPA